jgi:hypothetical protein
VQWINLWWEVARLYFLLRGCVSPLLQIKTADGCVCECVSVLCIRVSVKHVCMSVETSYLSVGETPNSKQKVNKPN